MARVGQRTPSGKLSFGRIDPFCWAAVVPLLLAAALAVWSQFAPMAIAVGLLAVLIVVGDAWINRPRPFDE